VGGVAGWGGVPERRRTEESRSEAPSVGVMRTWVADTVDSVFNSIFKLGLTVFHSPLGTNSALKLTECFLKSTERSLNVP
jgi:hypothetical protein